MNESHLKQNNHTYMLFLKSGALDLGEDIVITDGMSCQKMELYCRNFDYINRVGTARYDYHYLIKPYSYLGQKTG